MIKKILFVLLNTAIAVNLGCSNTGTTNSPANQAVVTNANSTHMPEGLSGNQVPLSANSTPGIPDPKSINANNNPGGGNSIPGIPDTTRAGKTPMPKNTPPIPGIPDEETLRKQMNTPMNKEMMDRKPPETDSNSANRPPAKRQATRQP